MRVRLKAAYDGTNYHGWQMQDNGDSIEQEINLALTKLLGVPVEVIGASRTDAGVHALGNICVFDVPPESPAAKMPADRYAYALNHRLPEDIRIMASDEVSPLWHPRHEACHKTYEYRIELSGVGNPIGRQYRHLLHGALDVPAMRQAAEYLTGTHDYRSFCSTGTQAKDFVRTITAFTIEEAADGVLLSVTGTGFLYNMVRIMAGTLIEVGWGKRKPADMPAVLAACDRGAAGHTAPACGLTLVRIVYDQEEKSLQNQPG